MLTVVASRNILLHGFVRNPLDSLHRVRTTFGSLRSATARWLFSQSAAGKMSDIGNGATHAAVHANPGTS